MGEVARADFVENVVAPVAVELEIGARQADLAEAQAFRQRAGAGIVRHDRRLDAVQVELLERKPQHIGERAAHHRAALVQPVEHVAERGGLEWPARDAVEVDLADHRFALELDAETVGLVVAPLGARQAAGGAPVLAREIVVRAGRGIGAEALAVIGEKPGDLARVGSMKRDEVVHETLSSAFVGQASSGRVSGGGSMLRKSPFAIRADCAEPA